VGEIISECVGGIIPESWAPSPGISNLAHVDLAGGKQGPEQLKAA